jgi:carbon-monoxide dehydrogenase large subunit
MNAPDRSGVAAMRFGSGHTVRRIEDPTLVSGQGRYTDDLQRDGLAHLVFVRSPHAHARLVGVDVQAARAMPGVLAVFTGAELAAAGVKPLPGPPPSFKRGDGTVSPTAPRQALAHQAVHFVGQAVAAVVAETRAQAVDAAEAVMVDYEELPVVTGLRAAFEPGAPRAFEGAPDNLVAEARHGDAAACEAAFARAAHVVRLEIANQRLAPSPIEPRVSMAEIEADNGRLVMSLSNQMPTGIRDSLVALIPGLKAEDVRVRVGDVGGGFGMKTGLYPEDLAVAWAALQLKRPVRWRAQRVEEFTTAVHGRDWLTEAELALDASGRVLAMRQRTWANAGGCPTPTGCMIPLVMGSLVATSVYDIPQVDLHIQVAATHTAPVAAYRGAGRPESIYIVERLMDEAARTLGMDAAELRRRNLVPATRMPFTTPTKQVYDSGEFEKMLDQALALADWAGYAPRAATSKSNGRLRGRSITTFLEWTGGPVLTEHVKVEVTADGYIELTSATMAMGQGIATSYAQLAVDAFGVPIERIRVLQGDTDRANGFGSAGSRSLFTGGGAVHVASRKTLDHAKELAAEALEAAASDLEYEAGQFRVVGTDVQVGLFELAARQAAGRISVGAEASAAAPSWPNAAHVCEVEIDPDTGEVQIVRYDSVNDIGRVISPQIVQGQLEGGAVQGIGQALSEQVVYDEGGQLLTASFMDYAMPRADGFIGFRTVFDTSVPCKTNVLGAKGVGELGTIGATPAVANAVVDALISAGVPRKTALALQMPFTADKVWLALQGRA